MTNHPHHLLLVYYGDDFTAGVPEPCRRPYRAVHGATPGGAAGTLPELAGDRRGRYDACHGSQADGADAASCFRGATATGGAHVHYKVCSTRIC